MYESSLSCDFNIQINLMPHLRMLIALIGFVKSESLKNLIILPFGFKGWIRALIASVPDQCLLFDLQIKLNKYILQTIYNCHLLSTFKI